MMPIKLTFFFVLLMSNCVSLINSVDAQNQPNIIFVLTDDQRYDTLGCTGNQFIETPNLDKLAEEGTLFTNASVTSAICTPSRASYFLGQYERKHGVNFNSGTSMREVAWNQSYPMCLKRAGYYTAYIGKNHVPIGSSGYASGVIDRSFDFWYAGHRHLWFYPKTRHPIFRQAQADTQIEIIDEGAISFLDSKTNYIKGAKAFLSNRPKEQPFCLSIALNLPHGAGTSTMKMKPDDPPLYVSKYRNKLDQLSVPQTYVAKGQIRTPRLPESVLYSRFRQTGYNYVDEPKLLKERMIRRAQTITGIDNLIGRIRTQLAQEGLSDNTIIVFSSDHGLMNGEFGLGGKALNYESCLRVPMIVMDPRVAPSQQGRRSHALVESIDIAPTILDFGGVETPDSIQGRSLRAIVEGKASSVRKFSFAENLWSTYFGNPRIESVKTDDGWKYIRYFKNDRAQFAGVTKKTMYQVTQSQIDSYAAWLTSSIKGEQPVYEELYCLTTDPTESNNLASRTVYAQRLAQLRQECQRLVTFAKGDIDEKPATIVIAKPPEIPTTK